MTTQEIPPYAEQSQVGILVDHETGIAVALYEHREYTGFQQSDDVCGRVLLRKSLVTDGGQPVMKTDNPHAFAVQTQLGNRLMFLE